MSPATATRSRSRYTRIWAAAKSLGLSNDDVHDILDREFQKESLKDLTDKQVDRFGTLLWDMNSGRQPNPRAKKRTDEGGRSDNIKQRRKIFMMAKVLGWNEASINQFCMTEYQISCHEWLPPKKCSNMIDAMRAIAKREGREFID